MDIPDHADDMPAGALAALGERYGDALWTLVHAWIDDETVLAVISVAPDAAFDASSDAFDVDIVEVHMLRIFDTLQGEWDVVADHEMRLGTLFEDFVKTWLDRTEPPS